MTVTNINKINSQLKDYGFSDAIITKLITSLILEDMINSVLLNKTPYHRTHKILNDMIEDKVVTLEEAVFIRMLI